MVKVGDPEKAKILVLAPTGVAAVSISCTTIHSGLGKKFGRKMFPLNDRQRTSLRNKPSEVRFIIIDENSMVSSMIFYQVNEDLINYLDVVIQHALVVFQYLPVATFISCPQLNEVRCTVLAYPLKVFQVWICGECF